MSGICLNEDNSNFFKSFLQQAMTAENLRQHAADYAVGQVQKVIFCTNGQRASFGSKAIDPIWTEVEQTPGGQLQFRGRLLSPAEEAWVRNARTLYEAGIDPYAIWLTTVKQANREAWLSCRMNDATDLERTNTLNQDEFWRNNPTYRRAPYDNDPLGQVLDFSFSEVRDYKLNFLTELVETYDLDGLELDWMQAPAYLRPGFEVEDAELVTDFMRQARRLVAAAQERWHHDVKLSVRLPGTPEQARRLGLDFLGWNAESLMDEVTVSNGWPTTDSDMPLELWRGLLGPSITLNAGLELCIQAYPDAPAPVQSADMLFGFASQFLHRGADNIYLYHHMNGVLGLHSPEAMEQALNNAGEKETAYPMPRRHVVTYATQCALGIPQTQALPLIPDATWQPIRLNLGGGTESRFALINLGFDSSDLPELDVRLNGEPCLSGAEPSEQPCPENVISQRQFQVPFRSLHDGDNVIQLRLKSGNPATIVWCEIILP